MEEYELESLEAGLVDPLPGDLRGAVTQVGHVVVVVLPNVPGLGSDDASHHGTIQGEAVEASHGSDHS